MKSATFLRRFAASLVLAGTVSGAQATLIDFDLDSNGADLFGPGPAVFGTSSSVWNHLSRATSASNFSLVDDTGSATSVTLSYTRLGSGSPNLSAGAYYNLLYSTVSSGTVTLSGLDAGAAYDLVIFSSWDGQPGVNVDGVTKTFATQQVSDALVEGQNFVRFLTHANANGVVTFAPTDNPTGLAQFKAWSGFQLQSAASVPEPGAAALLLAGALAAVARRRSARGGARR